MNVLVTGGTGQVGRFIVAALPRTGNRPVIAGRLATPKGEIKAEYRQYRLDPAGVRPCLFDDCQALVHCAFHHVPGRYRGGEGDDPDTFRNLNLHGTQALFEAAKKAGIAKAIFLSSRAVYGACPAGIQLHEEMNCRPDTLYGEVKLAAEQALAALADSAFQVASLRVTGIFGLPGQKLQKGLKSLDEIVADLVSRPDEKHKWSDLFHDFLSGEEIPPRAGTEIHGDDVAAAIITLLEKPLPANHEIFNLSDTMIDRRELLAAVKRAAGGSPALPQASDVSRFGVMETTKFRRFATSPD